MVYITQNKTQDFLYSPFFPPGITTDIEFGKVTYIDKFYIINLK